jgi:hypothetical protein
MNVFSFFPKFVKMEPGHFSAEPRNTYFAVFMHPVLYLLNLAFKVCKITSTL